MKARDDVVISFSHLQDGMTLSGQECPVCLGGKQKERALSVGNTGGLLWWKCHRASCNWRGGARVSGEANASPVPQDKYVKQFKRRSLPDGLLRTLAKQFHVQPETIKKAGWSYTPDYPRRNGAMEARVVQPILDRNGVARGETLRSYWDSKPKAIIHSIREENQICWYNWRKYGKTLVMVEDQASALRIAEQNIDALALCGTGINFERALEIRKARYERVLLCLDDDATGKAVELLHKYGKYIPGLCMFKLDKDVKNMNPVEFEMYVQEISLP